MLKFHAQLALRVTCVAGLVLLAPLIVPGRQPAMQLMTAVDLNLGQAVEVKLHNGDTARVELLERMETPDKVRGAVRNSRVRVKVFLLADSRRAHWPSHHLSCSHLPDDIRSGNMGFR